MTDGKERAVYIPDPTAPGKTIRMTSKTMPPAFMREVRDLYYQKIDNKNADSALQNQSK